MSDFSANPPAYNASAYPPPQAPPPAYGVGPSEFSSTTVAVVTIAEEAPAKDTDGMFSFDEKSVRLGKPVSQMILGFFSVG